MSLALFHQHPESGESNGRYGRAGATVGVLLLLALGLTTMLVSRFSHSGGDPGGVVLRQLSPITGAVPSGSTGVSTNKHDAVWSAACPDNPSGRTGWSGVDVLTRFNSVDNAQAVVSAVGISLATQGWAPTLPVDDAAWQYTPLAEWTKSIPGTTSANVVLFKYPQDVGLLSAAPGSAWMLGAEGKTPGFALPGC